MKKIKPELTLEEAWGFDGLMATSAFRYCLGRQTYIVGACVDWLISNWEKFPQNVKTLIQREVEEEFVRDDEARMANIEALLEGNQIGYSSKTIRHYLALGHDCDRKEWARVRALWNKKEEEDEDFDSTGC